MKRKELTVLEAVACGVHEDLVDEYDEHRRRDVAGPSQQIHHKFLLSESHLCCDLFKSAMRTREALPSSLNHCSKNENSSIAHCWFVRRMQVRATMVYSCCRTLQGAL